MLLRGARRLAWHAFVPILVFWGAGEAEARFRPRLPSKPSNKPGVRPGYALDANGVLEARERKTGVGFLAAARSIKKSDIDTVPDLNNAD